MKIYPLILSGGSGSRLWPVSRSSRPKQFLSLNDERDMIAGTARRVHDHRMYRAPVVIAGADHRFLVKDALQAVGCPPSQVLLEPCGRNTAAAIAIGALSVAKEDPDAIILAMPSDHVVANEPKFRAAVEQALTAAEAGYVVTFGIKASRPDTGYGYIQKGEKLEVKKLFHIKRFCEKPDAKTAQRYLKAGNYYWNSGIFMFKASALMKEMRALCPKIIKGAEQALAAAKEDLGFIRLDVDAFAALPSVPFDIAVMEKTKHGAVLPSEFGWSDVGSWRSLWEIMPKDKKGNAGKGDTQFFSSSDCLAWSAPAMFTSVVGLKDVAVIVTDDAVLVMDKHRAEEVKDVVDHLKSAKRSEHVLASKVYRPWGNYQTVDKGKGYLVKRLEIKPGAKLSLQYHHHRAEHWTVVEGVATVTRGEETFDLHANASTYIEKKMKHRLENRQSVPLVLVEVQTGDLINEEDIVRLEDNYGRT
jgi:mannose-1-phosphate guanylyltransferase/mannose-6-phosphate isomerase